MAQSFASILDQPASSSERPPLIPVGSYVCAIKGLPRRDKSSKKGTEFIEYTIQPVSAVDGTVDSDELQALGHLSSITFPKLTFYFTEKSAYRHKEFLRDDLGMEFEDDDSHWSLAQQAPGNQFIAQIKHRPSDDGKSMFADIAGTAPVE